MLWPLAQPALVQNGLQPVWLLSRALLSRSPRAAVVLAAASSSNDGGVAPYKKEHLVWEDGFGARFAGSLLVCCAVAVGASLSPEAWLPAAHGAQAALRRQLLRLCHRLEWWSALGLLSSPCCALQVRVRVRVRARVRVRVTVRVRARARARARVRVRVGP